MLSAMIGIGKEKLDEFMLIALEEATAAGARGEVPVGAAVVREDSVISRAGNEIEQRFDASAHAELLAIRAASAQLENWRLDDCLLFVTVEPCAMCAGAILQARIPMVVYGATEPKFGALGSRCDLSMLEGSRLKVVSGIQEERSRELLQNFFKAQRS